jgi:hypothetical protein
LVVDILGMRSVRGRKKKQGEEAGIEDTVSGDVEGAR